MSSSRSARERDPGEAEGDWRRERRHAKAQLETEKASLVDDRKLTENALRNDMGFIGDVPPDFNDDKALDAARAKRDSGKFADWAKDTLNYVRRNNGTTPWGNEDLRGPTTSALRGGAECRRRCPIVPG